MGAYNVRRSNGSLRDKMRARLAAKRRPCWMCGLPIDYSLPHGHPRCFECDELDPVSKGGSPFDPANLDAAHRCCNQWRGNMSVAAVAAARSAALADGRAWSTPEEFASTMREYARDRTRAVQRARRLSDALRAEGQRPRVSEPVQGPQGGGTSS